MDGRSDTDQPTLKTDRLVLRRFEIGDAPVVRELAGDREIADTTLLIPHPYPAGTAESWIRAHALEWEMGAGVTYAITDIGNGDIIGAIALSIAREHARGEIGYWIALANWNRGYCTEAAEAMLAFAFEKVGLHRVEARHFARNPASGRVLQKLGMRLEGLQREAIRKWDRFEDMALYAILRTEWTERRNRSDRLPERKLQTPR